jgi:hypothetical protein
VHCIRWRSALTAVAAASLLSSCGGTITDSYTIEHQPAVAEPVRGTDHVRVTVEKEAVERLRIQTSRVEKAPGGLVVPSAAVFVDPEGQWWVYTSPERFVYQRQRVAVVREDGGQAFLSRGPSVGSEVVTRGAPELYGVEDESGH